MIVLIPGALRLANIVLRLRREIAEEKWGMSDDVQSCRFLHRIYRTYAVPLFKGGNRGIFERKKLDKLSIESVNPRKIPLNPPLKRGTFLPKS